MISHSNIYISYVGIINQQTLGVEIQTMGLLDTVQPILGYVIAIAVVLLIATLTFMSAVSTAIIQSATTMAQVLVLVALLVGIAAAARAAKEVA
jgi:hypothetical protein